MRTYNDVLHEGLFNTTLMAVLGNLKLIATVGVLAILLAAYVTLSTAREDANDVRKRGETILFHRFNFHVVSIPTVQIRALPVYITAKSSTDLPPPLRSGTTCMLYFGKANNTAVIYDVTNRRTIRIPTDELSISVDLRKRRLDSVCLPPPSASANDERGLG
jgi:hypothetical protein